MELNAENLFDPIDDSESSDNDFLPEAPRAWSWRKFWKKLNLMSKVIAAAGEDSPIDAIALCEVENDTVLNYLTKASALRRIGYDYLITHGEDVRGMNVAFVYNPQTFKVLCYESVRPDFSNMSPKKTRDVLHVTGMVFTGDTLDVFVCHFPSRLDRRKQGRKYRMRLAEQIKGCVDSIFGVRKNPNIIITGDFNDTPTDKAITHGLGAKVMGSDVENPETEALYNLMSGKTARHGVCGTYYYKGNWEILDNFIVNGRLLDSTSRIHTNYNGCRIFDPEFLLTESEGEYIPFRTYKGYKYNGGFSDHLPVLVSFDYSW